MQTQKSFQHKVHMGRSEANFVPEALLLEEPPTYLWTVTTSRFSTAFVATVRESLCGRLLLEEDFGERAGKYSEQLRQLGSCAIPVVIAETCKISQSTTRRACRAKSSDPSPV